MTGSAVVDTDCESKPNNVIKTGCYIELAVAKNDPGVCEELGDYMLGKNACFSEVALEAKDPKVCELVEGDHPAALCLGRIGQETGDTSVCDSLNEPWQGQCVGMVES